MISHGITHPQTKRPPEAARDSYSPRFSFRFPQCESLRGAASSTAPLIDPSRRRRCATAAPNKIQFNGCRRIANLPQLHAQRRSGHS
jgi:hypothetical protein